MKIYHFSPKQIAENLTFKQYLRNLILPRVFEHNFLPAENCTCLSLQVFETCNSNTLVASVNHMG